MLHQQIEALKRNSAPLRYGSLGGLDIRGEIRGMSGETALDRRIIQGYLFTFGTKNRHKESFSRSAFDKTIRENGPQTGGHNTPPLLWQHDPSEPLAKFDLIETDSYGVFVRSKPLDDTETADRALKQVRSGTVNGMSGGFYPVWDKTEWKEEEQTILHNEVILLEGSLATVPSDVNTFIKRSAEEVDDILDQVEYFIRSLPKNKRLEARHLLTLYKSLESAEPQNIKKALESVTPEPVKRSIDYAALLLEFKNS